jgi:hypothetical protein
MAYATRARTRAAQSADTSPDKQQGRCDCGQCDGAVAQEDALSVEGSDTPDLAYGLANDDEMNMDDDDDGDDDQEAMDEDESASSEASYDSRSEGELEDTAAEMRELERTVKLEGVFQLVDRLGEGASRRSVPASCC